MPALILLVATDHGVVLRTKRILAEAGYLVAAVHTFERAKVLLDSLDPDLLIADVQLKAFNGLHLATRSLSDHPQVPVIITHSSPDIVLRSEATRLGASFVVKPLDNPDFMPLVEDALKDYGLRQPPIRRWKRKSISVVVEAELAAEPARLCDISYGGLKVAYGADCPLPDVFDVTVPQRGLTVKARSVWTFRSPDNAEFWCGAEVVGAGTPETAGWREFVDATA